MRGLPLWLGGKRPKITRAIVVGGGGTAPQDFARFALDGYAKTKHHVICVNETFLWLTRFDYWVSLHPENMGLWRDKALLMGRNLSRATIVLPKLGEDDLDALREKSGRNPRHSFAHTTLAWDSGGGNSGSSGMFGVRLAIALGCDRIVLAGVPMNNLPHWGRTAPWVDNHKFTAAWSAAEPRLKGKVRSQSGWTRELLGEPTLQWWSH